MFKGDDIFHAVIAALAPVICVAFGEEAMGVSQTGIYSTQSKITGGDICANGPNS